MHGFFKTQQHVLAKRGNVTRIHSSGCIGNYRRTRRKEKKNEKKIRINHGRPDTKNIQKQHHIGMSRATSKMLYDANLTKTVAEVTNLAMLISDHKCRKRNVRVPGPKSGLGSNSVAIDSTKLSNGSVTGRFSERL